MIAPLTVERLTVSYGGEADVVSDVSFAVGRGDVMGLVGESGSGKTTVALSMLGYRPADARIVGSVRLAGREILSLSEDEMRPIRGRHISYIPQNPTTALNPARTIGSLMVEFIEVHHAAADRGEARKLCGKRLEELGFPDPREVLARYPHQLSGGQQQRVAIAMATICRPDVVVLDEPTTGLDVSTQRSVLDLLRRLKQETGCAMVYVTHDLNVLREIATHVGVLYAGRLMELGPAGDVFDRPLHPYTRALIASRPSITHSRTTGRRLIGLLQRAELPSGCAFAPRCELAEPACRATVPPLEIVGPERRVACLRWREEAPAGESLASAALHSNRERIVLAARDVSVTYAAPRLFSLRRRPMTAVKGASFVLHAGEVLALVGESGSGKSSLARALAGLLPPSSGEILLGSEPVARLAGQRRPEQRRRLQLIFQNPDASLNPRRRVGAILASALRSFEGRRPKRLEARIAQALSEVRLPATYRDRFPDQLSGGERQRVAIARALIVDPEVLVCDEVLSALDVSVQAAILDLLRELCRNRNLAVLFISHDLAVVRSIAQRILVMFRGEIMSSTTAEGLLTPPLHPYVHELLSAIPGERIARPPPPFAHGGSGADGGCPFVIRCPVAIPRICRGIPPPLRGDGLRCHHEPAELRRLLPIEEGAESASPVHSVPRSLSFGMSAP